jgi:hypothetical protein
VISSPQKCIGFTHTVFWLVMQHGVEPQEVKQSTCLSSIEFLGHLKVFEVCMVGLDFDRVLSAFKVVPPLFKSSDNCKYLSIMNLIISLSGLITFNRNMTGSSLISS